ncbi:hypothetical protein DEMA109039_11560 [Deinococcus marmoris]
MSLRRVPRSVCTVDGKHAAYNKDDPRISGWAIGSWGSPISYPSLRYNRVTPKAKDIRQRETPRGSLAARIPQRVSVTEFFPFEREAFAYAHDTPQGAFRSMDRKGITPRLGAWRSKRRWKIRIPQKYHRQGNTFSPASCRNSGPEDAVVAHLMACSRSLRTHLHRHPLSLPPRLACLSIPKAPPHALKDRRRTKPLRCSSTSAASSVPAHPPNPGRWATGSRHRRPRPPGSRRPPQTAR